LADQKEADEIIQKLAVEIVDRHMAAPAVVLLESCKPLTFVGSQAMVFMNPIISIFATINNYNKYIELLEDRNNIEKLILEIENYEDEKIKNKKGKSNG